MKKEILKKLTAVAAVICVICAFAGCTSDKKDDKKDKASSSASDTQKAESEASVDSASTPSAETSADAPQVTTQAPSKEESMYGNAEIYTNDNGNPAAKTNDGTEVEFTNENMQKLFEEYEKVQGSGSEEEKKILDQIQLFLEASPNVEQAD